MSTTKNDGLNTDRLAERFEPDASQRTPERLETWGVLVRDRIGRHGDRPSLAEVWQFVKAL